MIFELCTDSLDGVLAAQDQQCKRVELCSALSIGGLTPSYGMVKQCVDMSSVEIHTMIRPREGDFVYSPLEIEIMENNIKQFALLGVKGVVFGVLNSDGSIAEINLQLLKLAKSYQLEVTFHRAFDFVNDVDSAILKLIDVGFDRLLSSGLAETAEIGLPILEKLQSNYGQKIQIMAGSGVSADNVQRFINSGIEHVHFTARKPISECSHLEMGIKMTVDEVKVKAIISSVS